MKKFTTKNENFFKIINKQQTKRKNRIHHPQNVLFHFKYKGDFNPEQLKGSISPPTLT